MTRRLRRRRPSLGTRVLLVTVDRVSKNKPLSLRSYKSATVLALELIYGKRAANRDYRQGGDLSHLQSILDQNFPREDPTFKLILDESTPRDHSMVDDNEEASQKMVMAVKSVIGDVDDVGDSDVYDGDNNRLVSPMISPTISLTVPTLNGTIDDDIVWNNDPMVNKRSRLAERGPLYVEQKKPESIPVTRKPMLVYLLDSMVSIEPELEHPPPKTKTNKPPVEASSKTGPNTVFNAKTVAVVVPTVLEKDSTTPKPPPPLQEDSLSPIHPTGNLNDTPLLKPGSKVKSAVRSNETVTSIPDAPSPIMSPTPSFLCQPRLVVQNKHPPEPVKMDASIQVEHRRYISTTTQTNSGWNINVAVQTSPKKRIAVVVQSESKRRRDTFVQVEPRNRVTKSIEAAIQATSDNPELRLDRQRYQFNGREQGRQEYSTIPWQTQTGGNFQPVVNNYYPLLHPPSHFYSIEAARLPFLADGENWGNRQEPVYLPHMANRQPPVVSFQEQSRTRYSQERVSPFHRHQSPAVFPITPPTGQSPEITVTPPLYPVLPYPLETYTDTTIILPQSTTTQQPILPKETYPTDEFLMVG